MSFSFQFFARSTEMSRNRRRVPTSVAIAPRWMTKPSATIAGTITATPMPTSTLISEGTSVSSSVNGMPISITETEK